MLRLFRVGVLVCLSVLFTARPANADVTIFNVELNNGLAGFNAAAGSPPVTIDFDNIAIGTDIGGATILGITFLPRVGSAPLLVVNANDTYTPDGFTNVTDTTNNKLFSTSGQNVLSPGGIRLGPGPDSLIENDDLELVFAQPLMAFGFDHLSQSQDGVSRTDISVYNEADVRIYRGSLPISDPSPAVTEPGGADFWGVTTSGGDRIARIVIDEWDGDNKYADCNIGFDSFRYSPVPEPSSFVLVVFAGLFGAIAFFRQHNMRLNTSET